VIIAVGGSAAGYTLYVKDRRLVMSTTSSARTAIKVTSEIKQLTLLNVRTTMKIS
jgi:hypothetical protein